MFDDLKLRSWHPVTPEQIAAYVGVGCWIGNWNDRYTIISATPTDDPCVAAIEVVPRTTTPRTA